MFSNSRRLLAAGAATASLILLVSAGCASSQKSEPGADGSGGTLAVALEKAPGSLDPADMEQSTSAFAQPAYDALIKIDGEGNLVPGLATEWGFTDDENKVFELTVRDGVTFSDGTALDAEAVVANLEHLDDGRSNVVSLVNGGDYEAIDDDTVRISWDSPHPLAAQAFTQTWVAGMMISPEALAGDAEQLTTSTAGAGPYVLDAAQTVAGSRYVYTARDDYWDPANQHFDQITITVMENAEQRLNALRTGEVDYAAGDLGTAAAATDAGMQVLHAPTVVYGLSLLDREGTLDSPLQDLAVRQAINYAIDRQGISDALLGEYGSPAQQTVVSSEPGYVDALADAYPYDPEKARELLAEAGYADGFTLPVVASTSSTAATLSQVFAEQLAEVGITVELDSRPSADYFEGMTGGTFPAAVIGYGSQPVPMEYDGLFGPEAIFNPLGSSDDEINSTMEKAMAAPEEEATVLYQQVISRLVDQAWFAPAVYAPVFYYASEDLAPLSVSEARPQTPLNEIRPAN
ncbi:ABC transporter substrate-binding protein [Naumannella halotolerans]|uniref:Peptide/nickel transport system substrate-binding protein n=1 Tax=Naumannella halotolerans TaxID=993414 RepID=A0A4R7J7Q3_9ACTN|nr:ABC transporter substrate-binding protein [Naumannella halotolerans]TDT33294.1 peptide/nickel transport system substrate-binding protein [Naumannella halotolerans]